MMQPAFAEANTPLVIDRARMRGRGDRRELQHALQRAPIDGLGLGPSEFLLVPQLSVQERLQGGGINRAFSRSFSRALRGALEKAELDPSSYVDGGRPVRFSTFPRMAAWLISEPDAGEPYLAGLEANRAGRVTLQDWVRRVLLPDTPKVAQTARILLAKGALAEWLASLPEPDLGVLERGLKETYGISLPSTYAGKPDTIPAHATPDRIARYLTDLNVVEKMLLAYFENSELSAKQKAVGAALALLGTLPSSPRGPRFTRFINAVAAGQQDGTDGTPIISFGTAQPAAAQEHADQSSQPQDDGAQERETASLRTASQQAPASLDHDARNTRLTAQKPAEQPPLLTAPQPTPHTASNIMAGFGSNDLADNEAVFSSSFCGLLFLTNLLRRTGFVDDFGLTASSGCGLAPFELIDGVGQVWFGNEYRASRLHQWLAANAARQWTPRSFNHPMLNDQQIADQTCSLVRDGSHITIWFRNGLPLRDLPMRSQSKLAARTLKPLTTRAFSSPPPIPA